MELERNSAGGEVGSQPAEKVERGVELFDYVDKGCRKIIGDDKFRRFH